MRETEGTGLEDLIEEAQVRCSMPVDAAVHLQRTDRGIALHLIRYDYDPERDCVPPLDELSVEVDLDDAYDLVDAFGAGGAPAATLERQGTRHKLKLERVPLYSIYELHGSQGEGD